MTIKIIGKSLIKYRVTCTDPACRGILEFDSSDIEEKSASVMGRSEAVGRGITCPSCRHILKEEIFERLGA